MAGYSVQFTVVDNATKQVDAINRRILAMRGPIDRMSKSVNKFVDVSGLKKVADGFGWISRSVATVVGGLTEMVPLLGVITGGATIAGMVKLVGTFAAWGNQLQTNADLIGITTTQLQQFQNATMRAGGSAQDMTETLKNLHNISAAAMTGQNNTAMAYFNNFGINVRSANGQLKTATELLPEVFHALDGLKDPFDRAKVAGALLGDEQAKLYEEFKQSGGSLQDFLALENKHQELTEDQLKTLNKYRIAVAGVSTDFTNLGQSISVALAGDLLPFVKELDKWVQSHQPEIVKAIDQISTGFAQWAENTNWDQLASDIKGIGGDLQTVLDVMNAIDGVMNRINNGTIFDHEISRKDVLTNSPAYSALSAAQQAQVRAQLGITDAAAAAAAHPAYNTQPFSYLNPGSWLNRAPAGVDPVTGKPFNTPGAFSPGGQPQFNPMANLPPEAKGFLKTVAGGESYGGDYHAIVGGGDFSGNQYPTVPGWHNSHAVGAYQDQPGTWDRIVKGTGLQDFSPASQDKGNWWLAQQDYHTRTGRDLAADLKRGGMSSYIAANLSGTWSSLSNPGTSAILDANLADAQAPPAAAPPPAPLNGSVDVNFTGTVPPGVGVKATGKGAVNLGGPRVENIPQGWGGP